jgi:aminopeptidase
MQRYADKKMVWCGTQFPTHADAQEASMSLTEFEDFVYASCFLDHDDPIAKWKEVEREQEIWCKWFTGKSEYHVIAPGTDLKIRSDKRLWVNCCGHENMPDGEIFTSPVEDSANGHITFSFPGIFNGHEIENIRLEIRDGKVVEATASRGEAILKSLLATDEGASRFGEFAIGQNYAIKNNTKNMLFDEKIGGTIHLAVGAGMPECSSTNESAIHWDMLCDMREGGRLYADGQLCYENGKLLESVL